MRSHLPRNKSRSVHSSPSPSPPPSPRLQPHQSGSPSSSGITIPSREKRRSFSTRQAVGSRPIPSRNPSSENRLLQLNSKPEDPRPRRRRESHNASRTHRNSHSKGLPRLELPVDSEATSFPGGLRSWPSYSTHAEASVSSPGGIEEDDNFSSSDTEVGDPRGSQRPFPAKNRLAESDLDFTSEERRHSGAQDGTIPDALQTSREPSPRPHHLSLAGNTDGTSSHAMTRSGSNGSETDASRLSVKERWLKVVREVRRSAS